MSSLSERLSQIREKEYTPATPTRTLAQRVGGTGESKAIEYFEELKGRLHASLLESLGPRLYSTDLQQTDLEAAVRETLLSVLEAESVPLTTSDRTRLIQEVADEILGHGPLEPLLRDPEVSEIIVNGANKVFVERAGKLQRTTVTFPSEEALRRVIEKIVARVGRRVDESSPMVDARLPDGSRVNAVIPPIALDGSSLTIRKFSIDPLSADDLVAFGTFTPEVRILLESAVGGRLNILISGGTGSGKTTTLNVLSSFIPHDERIVTIEDAAELQLQQDHVVRLESRPPNIEGRGEITIRELVRNALRMRPDRIIVGEVRDAAALDMLQAMNTGHDGSLTTVHANTPRDALARIETMCLMAGVDLPSRSIREQIASAIHMVVQQARLRDGSRRITYITEVLHMEGDIVTTQDLFTYDYRGSEGAGGALVATGIRPTFLDELRSRNLPLPTIYTTVVL